jgi:carboxypeptidase Q
LSRLRPGGNAAVRAFPSLCWVFLGLGGGEADVNPLLLQGVPVAGLTPDSQRYFDYHHSAIDTIDQVNPRELHLGAAAMAARIWLVDTQGL